MPTGDAYSSGHLVLSHFGTCMCSNVETNLSWTCLVSGLLNFEHPSVLLFCFVYQEKVCIVFYIAFKQYGTHTLRRSFDILAHTKAILKYADKANSTANTSNKIQLYMKEVALNLNPRPWGIKGEKAMFSPISLQRSTYRCWYSAFIN